MKGSRERARIHWLDRLVDELEEKLRDKGKPLLIFNGGLSVSGVQHIGRLRGEILIPEAVRRELERRGYKVKQYLTLYTQDPWKGKKEQVAQFPDPEEARKRYTGWPLVRVPDPEGCHVNWVDHYWEDFGPYIPVFTDGKVEVVTTTHLYRTRLKEFTLRLVIPKREEVRRVINKYRGRKPYPEGWIPVEPICRKCGRIDTTEAQEILEGGEKVRYRCNHCGYEGVASVEDSKLNWRIEWVGVWWSLDVDFEPYGKDHATPGGSRDSCNDLAVNVFGFRPPEGLPYEWVAIKVGGRESDMTSSGFVGVTPREWLEVAHPQILRFLYFLHPPMKKVAVDMAEIPQYYSQYYRAERIYFGLEEARDEESEYLRRTYELSHPVEPPREPPSQPPYSHVAIIVQVVPEDKLPDEALKRLRRGGHLKDDEYSLLWAKELIYKALNWVKRYAPDRFKFEIPERVEPEVAAGIRDPERLRRVVAALEAVEPWTEEKIREGLVDFGGGMNPKERREFYRDFYLAIVGKPYGPRAAPLLEVLGKEFSLKRLREAAELAETSRKS